jgi:hypothetical protein
MEARRKRVKREVKALFYGAEYVNTKEEEAKK